MYTGSGEKQVEIPLPTVPYPPVQPQDFAAFTEARWYAAYTWAKHEKRVAEQLAWREVEYFLPLYASVRRWKDRRVRLQLPLFPGYVFVRLALRHRLQVLQIPSVVRLVGFNGYPTPLLESEVAAIRTCLAQAYRVEPHPYLQVGRRVRIKSGPLEGQEGLLLRKKGNFRVVISVDLIQRSMIVDVDATDIEPVFSSRKVFDNAKSPNGSLTMPRLKLKRISEDLPSRRSLESCG